MYDYTKIRLENADGKEARLLYWDGIQSLLNEKKKQAEEIRDAYLTPQKLLSDREKYRQDYIRMLGWPLTELAERKVPAAKKELVTKTDFLTIYRLSLETLPGLWFQGLIFEPMRRQEKAPLTFLLPGGSYCAEELIAHGEFTCGQYKNIAGTFVEAGVMVFAPQLLLWGDPEIGFEQPQSRQLIDAKLKAIGGSVTALEIYNCVQALDYLLATEEVDAQRTGVAGLSYGGFYTLYLAAVEERFRSVFASCFFCDRFTNAKGGSRTDWLWQNCAHTFFDAEVAALIAPRALYIENGSKDNLFPVEEVLHEQERLKPFYEAAGASGKLRVHIGEGGHEVDAGGEGAAFFLEHLL